MSRETFIATAKISSARPETMEDFERLRLGLLRKLLDSLAASHRSLLTMDLAGIERGTREQLDLSWRLAEHLRRRAEIKAAVVPEKTLGVALESSREQLGRELSEIESGVFQALRLHSALLVRARRKLRVMMNMLADPALGYGSLLERTGVVGLIPDSQPQEI